LRIAIAGLGAAALRGHLPALEALASEGKVTIVGGCDPDQQRCLVAGRAYPQIPMFASAQEMLASIDSGLLVIAANPGVHAELAALGAAHGQHILCEKPAGSTESHVDTFAAIRRRYPDRGLVAMYQYRFSRAWIMAVRFLQEAAKSQASFVMSVDVQRPVVDRHAVSNWREDPSMGGALADHAVHFLALARALRGPLDVVSSEREYDVYRQEHAKASLRVGMDTLDVSVDYGACERSTSISLACGEVALRWRDDALSLERRGQEGHSLRVPALADRRHIDALYFPMYRNVLAGLKHSGWRRRRAQELLEVGYGLNALLAVARPRESRQIVALAA
jgi:predicted dehydrogenase